jgi:hypothetical protein
MKERLTRSLRSLVPPLARTAGLLTKKAALFGGFRIFKQMRHGQRCLFRIAMTVNWSRRVRRRRIGVCHNRSPAQGDNGE